MGLSVLIYFYFNQVDVIAIPKRNIIVRIRALQFNQVAAERRPFVSTVGRAGVDE